MLGTILGGNRLWSRGVPLIAVALFAFAVLGLGTVAAPPNAVADDVMVSTDPGRIARGGRLYDKWFKVIKADKPEETHAAWPAANTKKKGDTTWRCKSCHGWDYMGKDGAYADGSYKTGITGLRAYADVDPAKIVAVMKDETHGLAGKMDERDFADLALFVSKGQVEMDKYIDRATKTPKGDKTRGQVYYETVCVNCHGEKGTKVKDMKPLGYLMKNPWEIMHKILYGQPDEAMPALVAFDRQITVDIMAYLTTLPKEK